MFQSLASLEAQLATLADRIKQTNHLIQKLSRYSPSSAPSSRGATTPQTTADTNAPPSLQRSDTGSGLVDRADLTADIHDALKQHQEALEWLQVDVDDVGGAATRGSEGGVMGRLSGVASYKRRSGTTSKEKELAVTHVTSACEKLGQELRIARIRFRKAQLQAKHNEESALNAENAAYLANLQAAANALPEIGTEAESNSKGEPASRPVVSLFGNRRGPRRDPNATQADVLLNATADVTSSLRRTHALLTDELSRSRFAKETLDTSNEALKELNERYSGLDDLLSKSRGLLGTLLRSQKSDTWYLETTIYVLLATIAWLFFRKLLYGPALYLVIWPLRFLWRVTLGVLGVAGVTGGASTVASGADTYRAQGSLTGGIPQASHIAGHTDEEYRGNEGLSGSMNQRISSIISGGATAVPSEAANGSGGQPIEADAGDPNTQEHVPEDPQARQREERDPVRRGDGQVLQERDERRQPRNPKKRMMEGDQGQQRRNEL